jgi:hypothetical protein
MGEAATRPKGYSYVRMSTNIQLKGDSLRRQLDQSRDFAERNGIEFVEGFTLHDIGVSAFKGANITGGALGTFLEAVNVGKIEPGSYLLVESLDRISRQDIMPSLTIFMDLVKAGINLVTLADNHVYRAGKTDMSDLMYSIMVMSRAHEESPYQEPPSQFRMGQQTEEHRPTETHAPMPRMVDPFSGQDLLRHRRLQSRCGSINLQGQRRRDRKLFDCPQVESGWRKAIRTFIRLAPLLHHKTARKPCRDRRVPAAPRHARHAHPGRRPDRRLFPSDRRHRAVSTGSTVAIWPAIWCRRPPGRSDQQHLLGHRHVWVLPLPLPISDIAVG